MDSILAIAKQVILTESEEIINLKDKLDDNFITACTIIKNSKGKLILMGVGKSGHIAKKLSATFASTGTPSFFVHPTEAGHGDLGMLTSDDVCMLVSYSGNSNEILTLIPIIKRLGVPIIAMTGNKQSAIAKSALVHLDISVKKEACPHNLTPTSSTTATLVMGDALAISLLNDKGFSADDFARTHPLGALGRRLLISVYDIMRNKNNAPIVYENIPLMDTLLLMSEKTMGFVIALDDDNKLLGVFTDGDLRRLLQTNKDISNLNIYDVITKNSRSINQNKPAISALDIMDKFKINSLPVCDDNDKIIGAINMHSLLMAKII